MPDPLATVLRIRRVTVDDARRRLAESLKSEEAAAVAAVAADLAIGVEGEVAADLASGDGAVEAYAAWLPVGRAAAAAALEHWDHCRSEVAKARAAVTVARAAAEAADKLLDRRKEEAGKIAARKAQAELDEIAGRARPH